MKEPIWTENRHAEHDFIANLRAERDFVANLRAEHDFVANLRAEHDFFTGSPQCRKLECFWISFVGYRK